MNIIVMVLLIFLSISIAVGVMIDTLTRRSKHWTPKRLSSIRILTGFWKDFRRETFTRLQILWGMC